MHSLLAFPKLSILLGRNQWEDLAGKMGSSFDISAEMEFREHLMREAKQLYAKCGKQNEAPQTPKVFWLAGT